MKKIFLLSFIFCSCLFSKEYILEFNNQKIDIKLNESTILKINENESINVILKEKDEHLYVFEKGLLEFKYKSSNKPMFQQLNKELNQIVMFNNKTNQIIIQHYNFKVDKNLIYENILMTFKKDSSVEIHPVHTLVTKQINNELLIGDSFLISEENVNTKYVFFYKNIGKDTLVIIESNVFNDREPKDKDKGKNYNLFWQTLKF